MKNSPSFLLLHLLLLLPLLLLLAPGRLLTCALALQCPAEFQTVDQEYDYIGSVPYTGHGQGSRTMYVRPRGNLKVVLKVYGNSPKNYAAEFLLEKDCFEGDRQWWELFMEVKSLNTIYIGQNHVKTTYGFQVRTSTCIKQCAGTVNILRLNKLDIWASGASQWKYSYLERRCGHVAHWNTDPYQNTYLTCSEVNKLLLLNTNPATTIPTSVTPTTTPITPMTTPATATTTPTSPTSIPNNTPAGQPAGVIAGVIAAVAVVAAAAIVMIVVRKRRSVPTTEVVAMRLQSAAESRRAECVNSLYEPAGSQQPVHDTAGRQAAANSLYETVDRHDSVNSLYESFENF